MLEGLPVAGLVNQLPDRDDEVADFLVGGEGALAEELDFEDQPILAGMGFVDCEGDGEVPGGVGAGVSVDLGFDLVVAVGVAGE